MLPLTDLNEISRKQIIALRSRSEAHGRFELHCASRQTVGLYSLADLERTMWTLGLRNVSKETAVLATPPDEAFWPCICSLLRESVGLKHQMYFRKYCRLNQPMVAGFLIFPSYKGVTINTDLSGPRSYVHLERDRWL